MKIVSLEAAARAAETVRERQAAEGEALETELNGVRDQLANRDAELEQANEQLRLRLQEVSPLPSNC